MLRGFVVLMLLFLLLVLLWLFGGGLRNSRTRRQGGRGHTTGGGPGFRHGGVGGKERHGSRIRARQQSQTDPQKAAHGRPWKLVSSVSQPKSGPRRSSTRARAGTDCRFALGRGAPPSNARKQRERLGAARNEAVGNEALDH